MGDGKTVRSGTVSVLYNNHICTTCWSHDGKKKLKTEDMIKKDLTLNTGHINREKAADTTYLTIDGEGVLQQVTNGNNGLQNMWYKNDLSAWRQHRLPCLLYSLYNVEYNHLIVSYYILDLMLNVSYVSILFVTKRTSNAC